MGGISGQQSQSHSGVKDYYGGMTWGLPQRMYRNFINPMIQGFGYGDRAEKFRDNSLPGATGPLADYMRQVGGLAGTQVPQAIALGNDIAQQAPQLYGRLQDQIGGALGTLPGLQAGAGDISEKSKFLVDQAFSPINSRALYQETMNRALEPARQSQAARGLLEQGTSQQMEQDLGQNTAYQFAMNDQQNQLNSLQNYGGALQNQLGFNTAGVGLAQTGMSGLDQFTAQMANALNIPMATASNLFQLLSGGINQGQQLAQTTGPQPFSNSKSGGGSI